MTTFEGMMEAYRAALAVLSAASLGMAWWRKGSSEEDKIVAEAHEVILNAVSDADFRRKAEVLSGAESELTVEQLMEMRREADLRRFGHGRN